MLCLHGTGGNRTNCILKEFRGLKANPPRKVWQTGLSESFEGVYFSVEFKRAVSAAILAMDMDGGDEAAIIICDINLKNKCIRLDEDYLQLKSGKFLGKLGMKLNYGDFEVLSDAYLKYRKAEKSYLTSAKDFEDNYYNSVMRARNDLRLKTEKFLSKNWDLVDKMYKKGKKPYFRYCGDVSFWGRNRIVSIIKFGHEGIKFAYDSDCKDNKFKDKVVDDLNKWLKKTKYFQDEIYNIKYKEKEIYG